VATILIALFLMMSGQEKAEVADRVHAADMSVDSLKTSGAPKEKIDRLTDEIDQYKRKPTPQKWDALSLHLTTTTAEENVLLSRRNFVSSSALRLKEAGVSDEEIASFTAAANDRDAMMSTTRFNDLSDKITDAARRKGAESLVRFQTTPEEGAKIKYQSVCEREHQKHPSTVNGITNNCSEKLPIGNYYFWAERNGMATSSKDDVYKIVDKQPEPIVIQENKK